MCGRYGLTIEQEALAAAYGVERIFTSHRPRYNLAPTMVLPVLLAGEDGTPEIRDLRWGLVPSWARDPSIGNRLINARSETVASKPSFRDAWRRGRRCLVLADGFYEWQPAPGGKGPKRPHWIRMADGRPFAFGGIRERWDRGGAGPLHTFAILTVDATPDLRPLHDRMPVILGDPASRDRWIDSRTTPEEAAALLRPWGGDPLVAWPVGTAVNRPGNDGPELIEPLRDPGTG